MRTLTEGALSTDLLGQRALGGWSRLRGRERRPIRVEILQRERASSVVLLDGAGPDGTAVVAKRCRRPVAAKEEAIYRLLDELPLPTLRLYGRTADPDDDFDWLFLEVAPRRAYDPRRPEHRRLAGEWLGRLHTAAAGLPEPRLADRGPAAFRADLAAAEAAVGGALPGISSTGHGRSALEELRTGCRTLTAHWGELEAFCRRLPRTLVHGDLKREHLRLTANGAGPALVIFDWHEGGWGVPALDLAKFLGYRVSPSLDAYAAAVGERWPELDTETLVRLGWTGEALRAVASVRWELETLVWRPLTDLLPTLTVYAGWLAEVTRAEPWAEGAAAGPRARWPGPRSWH